MRGDRRAARGASWCPTSSPTAATSTAPTSSASPRSACPAIYSEGGTDYIGKPAGWGKEQANEYEQHRYHQPSDEFDPKWNFDGMIEDAQLGFYAGLVVATNPQMPTWNPGDEFEAIAQEVAGRGQPEGEVARALEPRIAPRRRR